MEPIVDKHVEVTAGVCSGRPRIAGTRIRVANIVLWTEQGTSPDEIVAEYPQLTLADVHAALAYYHDHSDQLEAQMKEDETFVRDFKNVTRADRYPEDKTQDKDDPISSG